MRHYDAMRELVEHRHFRIVAKYNADEAKDCVASDSEIAWLEAWHEAHIGGWGGHCRSMPEITNAVVADLIEFHMK